MSLPTAMVALESAVAGVYPTWTAYQGVPLKVTAPAFIVGNPQAVQLHVNARGASRYAIPVTFAVSIVGNAMELVDVADSEGAVFNALDCAESEAWLGQAVVTEVSDLRLVDNAGAPVFAIDLVVSLIA